jgi:hypothetical protein
VLVGDPVGVRKQIAARDGVGAGGDLRGGCGRRIDGIVGLLGQDSRRKLCPRLPSAARILYKNLYTVPYREPLQEFGSQTD